MQEKLSKIRVEASKKITACNSLESLENFEREYTGRKGILSELFTNLKDLSNDDKKEMGQLLNSVKSDLTSKIEQKKNELRISEINKSLNEDYLDVTLPGKSPTVGHLHPLSQVGREVEEIFGQMGFEIMDGPEVESEYYNFEALNIPASHPARDIQDTFFIDKEPDAKHGNLVLRTHTSPVQIRTMQSFGAPLRVIVPGRCFRYEATDATHETTFNQVEGLLVDKDISISHLKGVMIEFLSRLFGREIKVRFRPGYFPFVEPGLELDMSCIFCGREAGCRICKYSGYIEFMGSGMVHPNVLKAGGIDPQIYQGWAFGFGLTRLTMMRYGITDIRHLTSGDLRFLNQF